MNSKAKIGLGVGAFVIALGAAVGVGALAANLAGGDETAAAASGGSTQAAQGRQGGTSGRGGFDTSTIAESLATKLGVDQAKVEAALKEVMSASRPSGAASGRPSGAPSDAPSGDPTARPSGQPTDAAKGGSGGGNTQRIASMAKSLAEKLDLDEAKVLAALQEAMSASRPTDAGTQPSAEPTK